MRLHKKVRFLLSLISLCFGMLLSVRPALPQAASGTITGTVFDPQGAVVPGATVVITRVQQGVTHRAQTTGSGLYELRFLPPGEYRVEVEVEGFKKSVKTGLKLAIGQTMRADFTLELGEVAQQVSVQADATQLLKSESSEVGQVITQSQLSDLPLVSRDFYDLIRLNAGITEGIQGDNGDGLTINGGRVDQNMFMINGIDNLDLDSGASVRPPIDAIEEFQIQTGNFSAEFGRSAGGVIQVELRSGKNQFFGTAFEFLRNDKLDANGFFDNQVPPETGQTTAPKSKLRRNQFGFSLGGPIVKNKLFFFGDYQGTRELRGRSAKFSVPTLLEQQGDFSQTLAPDQPLFKNALTEELYETCDPANFSTCQKVPASAFDPAAAQIAGLYPEPNIPGFFVEGLGTFNNYTASGINEGNSDHFDVKIDYHPREKDSLSFHYLMLDTRGKTPGAWGDGIAGPCLGCQVVLDLLAGSSDGRTQNAGLTHVHTFSPAVVNEFRTGLSRSFFFQQTADGGRNLSDEFGIPNVNVDELTAGLPWFLFDPIPTWTGTSVFTPNLQGYTVYQFTDNLSLVKGKHRIKTGFDLRRRHSNQFGNFSGRSFQVFAPFFTGHSFADFLTGRPLFLQKGLPRGTRGIRGIDYGFYVQDDIKIHPRLTLNLGVRYELFPGYTEVGDRLSVVDPLAGVVQLAGREGSPRSFVGTDKDNWAPRFGFAWTPWADGKTVIRGGYGISYFNAGIIFSEAIFNPPFAESFTLLNIDFTTLDAARRLSDGLPPLDPFDSNNPSGAFLQPEFNQRSPYSQYFSLGIQRALPGDMLFDVAYVGTRGLKLPGEFDGNPAPPGPTINVDERRIYHDTIPNVTSISQQSTNLSSTYHSLQAKLQKTFSHGLQFLTTYTWAKSLDIVSGSFATGGEGEGSESSTPQNPFDLGADRGRSTFDRKHRFVFAYNYDLPFGQGRHFGGKWNPVVNGILGGWQINGILTLATGNPFSVFATSNAGCGCSGGDLRADRIKDGNLPKDQRSVDGWFDKTAFADPPSSTEFEGGGRYGNAGRNIIDGPGLAALDFSLFKEFRIKERLQLQFRGEFFNIFNRVNLLFPTPENKTWQAGGLITKALDPRIGQIGLKLIF